MVLMCIDSGNTSATVCGNVLLFKSCWAICEAGNVARYARRVCTVGQNATEIADELDRRLRLGAKNR